MGNFFIDEEDAVGCCYLVIGVVAQCHGDGVSAGIFASGAGEGEGDNIAFHGTGYSGSEVRIRGTVGFAVVNGSDRDSLLVDGEGAVGGGHFVVGVAAQGYRDGVSAGILASFAGQGVGDGIIFHVTCNGGGEGRVRLAVGFAKVVGHHCGGTRCDGELSVDSGELIVFVLAIVIIKGNIDGVSADSLAGFTT